jgi:hypothetical protein
MFIDHDITELINVDLNLTIFESPCICKKIKKKKIKKKESNIYL